jgi:hypothetical protein
MAGRDFAGEIKALREAQTYVSGATRLGRLLGGLVSLLPWWLSEAPWWAVPIFMIVCGWAGGFAYGAVVFRKLKHVIGVFYPELKL